MASYNEVNAAWDKVLPLPAVTTKEATRVARLISNKFARGSVWYSWMHNRKSWASTEVVTYSLRNNGLQRMVHDVSHWAHDVNHSGTLKAHSPVHAELERSMIEFVIEQGLHKPKGKKVVTPEDKKAKKLAQAQASLKRWKTKQKRATTAIKKLERKIKRLAIPS